MSFTRKLKLLSANLNALLPFKPVDGVTLPTFGSVIEVRWIIIRLYVRRVSVRCEDIAQPTAHRRTSVYRRSSRREDEEEPEKKRL